MFQQHQLPTNQPGCGDAGSVIVISAAVVPTPTAEVNSRFTMVLFISVVLIAVNAEFSTVKLSTVMFGDPCKPNDVVANDAVEAVPVTSPTKDAAVITPTALIPAETRAVPVPSTATKDSAFAGKVIVLFPATEAARSSVKPLVPPVSFNLDILTYYVFVCIYHIQEGLVGQVILLGNPSCVVISLSA